MFPAWPVIAFEPSLSPMTGYSHCKRRNRSPRSANTTGADATIAIP